MIFVALWACAEPARRDVEVVQQARGALADTAASLTIRLLDLSTSKVGGLAVLVSDSSDGSAKHLLIDGGDVGARVARTLARFQVGDLSLVVLTHAHDDHYGGLDAVMRTFRVAAFAYNGDPRNLVSYRRLLSTVERSATRPIIVRDSLRRVQVVTAGDTLWVTLLPPAPRSAIRNGDPINNRSVGVHLRYGAFSALIPGDAEHAQQRWWRQRFRRLLDADVLVASHHGANDANSSPRRPDWYNSVTPRLLLVGANGRQHPHRQVLDYARRLGIATYCTSSHGSIAVRASRDGEWTVRTERSMPCAAGIEVPAP
ncbi:MAG TPA: MBL fold metallo-hydrolase [Gemmatimonadaceae bacterium]|nr:MBL fold metallo-hydrolase [Gemmatimonadaceae bacterium]